MDQMVKQIVIGEHRFLKISMGALWALLCALVGVVFWQATVASSIAEAHQRLDRQKDAIHDIRVDVNETHQGISDIKADVGEIKGMIKVLLKERGI